MQTKINSLKRIVLLLAAVTFLSAHKTAHPFYLSVTEIKIDSQKKMVQVSCRPFLDDLQLSLQQEQKVKLQLLQITTANKEAVAQYVKKHLKIYIGSTPLQLNCLGYEIEEEALWCYLEAPLPNKSKQVSIDNSILCQTLNGQINIIHCSYNGQTQSMRIACPESRVEFKF